MSIFMLTGSLISSIIKKIRNFSWSLSKDKPIAWKAWEKLCQQKVKGRMGFKDLKVVSAICNRT